jgi:hypothetical protein
MVAQARGQLKVRVIVSYSQVQKLPSPIWIDEECVSPDKLP